jgi:O-antigen ligase
MLLAVTVSLPFAPKALWVRVGGLAKITGDTEEIKGMDEEGSAAARFELVQTGLALFQRNPITGVGLDGFRRANSTTSTDWRSRRYDAHNTYLKELVEVGIPGLLLLLGLLASVFWRAEQARRLALRRGSLDAYRILSLEIGLVAFLLTALFGMFANIAHTYLYLAAVWCFADVVHREQQLAG